MDNTQPSPNPPPRSKTGVIVGIIALAVVGVAVIFFMQLNQGSSEPPTTVTGNTVSYTTDGFTPSNLRIAVGDTVTWRNATSADITVDSNPHPIHTSYRPLNLGTITAGAEKQLAFTEAGIYHYHNHLNPIKQGTVTVG